MKKKKNKRMIFERLTLGKIVPNLATLSALIVGMTQVRFAIKGQWEFAVIAVVVAAFLDATDGRLARLFNSCSRFGAELDSLSDFAVFGLCPAIVIYLYSLSNLNRLGWIISSFFAICMCLRLARFNTHDIENVKTPLSGRFFVGVPAPAGAVLALFPIVLYNGFGLDIFKNEYFCTVDVLIAALLCVSRIPTLSLKHIRIKKSQHNIFMLLAVITIGIIFTYTWKAFFVIIAAYVASIFFCVSKARKIQKGSNDKKHSDSQL